MSVQMEITPSADSLRQVEAHARLIADLSRPDPQAMEDIAEAIRQGFARNFGAESGGDGAAWPALAPWTVAEREHVGYSGAHPILIRSGSYLYSWIESNYPHHVSLRESDGMGWTVAEGTSDPRASVLELGGASDSGHPVPARPVAQLSEQAEAEIGRRLLAWLTRKLP